MTHKDIVLKLIGPISPVGESGADEERLENLKKLCDLVDGLMFEIDHVASHKDRYEYSVKKAGEYADNFLKKH